MTIFNRRPAPQAEPEEPRDPVRSVQLPAPVLTHVAAEAEACGQSVEAYIARACESLYAQERAASGARPVVVRIPERAYEDIRDAARAMGHDVPGWVLDAVYWRYRHDRLDGPAAPDMDDGIEAEDD